MDALLATGDRDSAVELLFRVLENLSDEDMAAFKAAPAWPGRLAAAPTINCEIRGEITARLEPELARMITAPVLLVSGENSLDPAMPYAETAAEALPDARILVLDGHGHVADALYPEFFAARVTPFSSATGELHLCG